MNKAIFDLDLLKTFKILEEDFALFQETKIDPFRIIHVSKVLLIKLNARKQDAALGDLLDHLKLLESRFLKDSSIQDKDLLDELNVLVENIFENANYLNKAEYYSTNIFHLNDIGLHDMPVESLNVDIKNKKIILKTEACSYFGWANTSQAEFTFYEWEEIIIRAISLHYDSDYGNIHCIDVDDRDLDLKLIAFGGRSKDEGWYGYYLINPKVEIKFSMIESQNVEKV